eukprot:3688858-Rhodomonas_salina.1
MPLAHAPAPPSRSTLAPADTAPLFPVLHSSLSLSLSLVPPPRPPCASVDYTPPPLAPCSFCTS